MMITFNGREVSAIIAAWVKDKHGLDVESISFAAKPDGARNDPSMLMAEVVIRPGPETPSEARSCP